MLLGDSDFAICHRLYEILTVEIGLDEALLFTSIPH